MPKPAFHSVDDYISAQPESVQPILQNVRKTILKAAPALEESISYNIPAYKLSGERVLYFAAWKRYFSLYPATKTLLAEFKDELAGHEIQKSTIHFPFSQPLPARLIARITKFRAREAATRANAIPPARKKR